MVRVFELKETLENSDFIDNIYKINELTAKIIRTTQMNSEYANVNDLQYATIVSEKSKIALEKIYKII